MALSQVIYMSDNKRYIFSSSVKLWSVEHTVKAFLRTSSRTNTDYTAVTKWMGETGYICLRAFSRPFPEACSTMLMNSKIMVFENFVRWAWRRHCLIARDNGILGKYNSRWYVCLHYLRKDWSQGQVSGVRLFSNNTLLVVK